MGAESQVDDDDDDVCALKALAHVLHRDIWTVVC